ncbi:hypothetical protein QYF61_015456 [Mycteria americana]|uniref:Uncharacterized protein n=1 Tax=Mycteria americana TaxID=33587 RepID=A0AAN7N2M0_MYCAM|nr:hypothetical protein QYF61_015456 [Mycteria americana]
MGHLTSTCVTLSACTRASADHLRDCLKAGKHSIEYINKDKNTPFSPDFLPAQTKQAPFYWNGYGACSSPPKFFPYFTSSSLWALDRDLSPGSQGCCFMGAISKSLEPRGHLQGHRKLLQRCQPQKKDGLEAVGPRTAETKAGCSAHNVSHMKPGPMLDNPFSEEIFPNIQSKPPLAQLEAISSCPIACDLGEETNTHLSTTSFQVVVGSEKISPQPPFLQAKQPQFPQSLLIRLLLQTLHQLHCPSLDTLQHLSAFLYSSAKYRETTSLVLLATFSDTSQDAIGLLGHLGTLLAHIQLAIDQHPQVLCWAAFQPLFPKPVALHGVVVAQVQDLALSLVKPHTIDLSPSIQPVQVPLQSLPTLKQINTPTQLGVICKLTEGALDPLIQIVDKGIKQDWPQHRAQGNTACDRPPTGVNSIHHHSLGPAIQAVFYAAKHTPIQAMSSQFLQENAVGNGVKGFTKV